MDKKIVLETKNLKKYFGGIRAVDGINMKLYENEIVAIVGDNGAGKSTLIKIISGIYRKDDGETLINSKSIDIDSVKIARENGIETVYQDQLLMQPFDVASNLFLGREKIVKKPIGRFLKLIDFRYMKEEAKKLMGQLDIQIKKMDAPVAYLSGGQRQSVVVGRAIYWGGKILIFDEPTNNLGVKQEKKVMDLITTIREKYKVSIIIISHNIDHVFRLVDRIIVLRNGKVVGDRIKNNTNPNEIVSMITGLN